MTEKACTGHVVLIHNGADVSVIGDFSDKQAFDFVKALLAARPDLKRVVKLKEQK